MQNTRTLLCFAASRLHSNWKAAMYASPNSRNPFRGVESAQAAQAAIEMTEATHAASTRASVTPPANPAATRPINPFRTPHPAASLPRPGRPVDCTPGSTASVAIDMPATGPGLSHSDEPRILRSPARPPRGNSVTAPDDSWTAPSSHRQSAESGWSFRCVSGQCILLMLAVAAVTAMIIGTIFYCKKKDGRGYCSSNSNSTGGGVGNGPWPSYPP